MEEYTLPEQFIFSELEEANAEVARLHQAVSISGHAFLSVLELVEGFNVLEVERIADELSTRLDAISTDREVKAAARKAVA